MNEIGFEFGWYEPSGFDLLRVAVAGITLLAFGYSKNEKYKTVELVLCGFVIGLLSGDLSE